MKLTLNKTLTAVFLGLSMLIGSNPTSASAQPSANSSSTSTGDFSKRSIQGVWLIVVQRKDCQTGDLIGPPGRGLLTFAEGGTIDETTAPGALPPGVSLLRSPGHGIWERQNWRQYPTTMISQRLKPDGSFDGWTKVVATFQLSEDGNEFTALGSFEMISPNGVVLSTGCSLSTGTRLK